MASIVYKAANYALVALKDATGEGGCKETVLGAAITG